MIALMNLLDIYCFVLNTILDSTAVSIFVVILVENTVFFNPINSNSENCKLAPLEHSYRHYYSYRLNTIQPPFIDIRVFCLHSLPDYQNVEQSLIFSPPAEQTARFYCLESITFSISTELF